MTSSGATGIEADSAVRRRPRRQEPADKLPPHSHEAEVGVLGCILLEPSQCLAECMARFSNRSDYFYDLRHQSIFAAMVSMQRSGESIDVITLQQYLKDNGELDQIGGIGYLAELPNNVVSAANLSYYLDIVDEKYRLRKIHNTCVEVAEQVFNFSGDIDALCLEAQSRLATVFKPSSTDIVDESDWECLVNFDTSNDPSTIIGVRNGYTTRYLCRGHSAWLIGPSGVGKSSLMLQFGISFAIGQPLYGITPSRPLRVLMIQAENDKGDLAEMIQGIRQGLALDDFDEGAENKLQLVKSNFKALSVTGKVGQQFCAWLRTQIESFRADLVLVDPLLSFAGIDVSRQDQVSQFCRVWLGPVLHDTGAVLFSVHHTGKPQKQSKNDAPQTIYDLMYAGIGSSEMVNWARAVMLLQPCGEGVFRLILAKRGSRAWATNPPKDGQDAGEKTTTLWLRHATSGIIFWEQMQAPEEDAGGQDKADKKVGKPEQIANLIASSSVISELPAEGVGLREFCRRITSWLKSDQSPRKSLGQSGDGTIRKAISQLMDDHKLIKQNDSNNYIRS